MAGTVDPFNALVEAIANRVVEKLEKRTAGMGEPARSIRLPEASRITGLSKTKLRNMVACGVIQAHREGAAMLIKLSDIDAWMERSRIVHREAA